MTRNKFRTWSYTIPAAAVGISSAMSYSATNPMTQTPPQNIAPAPHPQGFSVIDDRLLETKLELAEARTDSKFAQFMGELRAIAIKIDQTAKEIGELKSEVAAVDAQVGATKSTIITTIIGAAIGIVGLTFAAVAIFQSGMGLSATAYQAGMSAAEAKKTSGK